MPTSIRHLTNEEFVHLPVGNWQNALRSAQVVIPARDVEATIGETLQYLTGLGFTRERVHVMVNSCTDQTAQVAEAAGLATVHREEAVFAAAGERLTVALARFGITVDRLRGKGSAMLAALLVLDGLDFADDTPVLFLDGDIKNIRAVDPASRLLAAWSAWRSEQVRIVKLAASGWDLPIRIAFAAHPVYHLLSALEWPLCGQMLVKWETLRHLRFATGYGVETAMLLQIWEWFQHLEAFGQVEIATPLKDGYSSSHDLATMYAGILAFMRRYTENCRLIELTASAVSALNRDLRTRAFYAPSPDGRLPSVFEERPIDALLPSLVEIGHAPRR